jgi:uncharacterized protein with NAD-binding domain and iron-sulfur cluster
VAEFAENDDRPGDPGADATPMTVAVLVQRALRLLGDFAGSLVERSGPDAATAPPALVLSTDPVPPSVAPRHRGHARALGAAPGTLASDAVLVGALAVVSTMSALSTAAASVLDETAAAQIAQSVDVVVTRLHADLAARVRDDDAARRTWQFLDLLRAIVGGIVADRLLDRPEGYAAVDNEDYRDWLVRHGASAETIASPLVRVVYDLVFGYEDGDDERPRFAAGTGLLLSGKMFFDYRGAIFWKMTAGMGDVVFAPLYDALRARGVEFRFFHRVDALRTSADRRRIDAIDLGVQAHVVGDTAAYEPLVDVGGLRCWPASPRGELLDREPWGEPDELESIGSPAADVDSMTLTAGRDFDRVVLAIPVGMHPYICRDLIENPRTPQWRAMTEHVRTVATQAVQLWLRADETELGWGVADVTTSGYPGTFHTYASMSHLLAREQWPAADRPKSVAYFCHVLPTEEPAPGDADPDSPRQERDRVRARTVEFLRREVGHLWPNAVVGGDFRWDLLCGDDAAVGAARLDAQYVRANVDPSERYVLSVPGSGRYRLRADESGYDNLVLAGDWTDSGLNAGCIEGAVVSGIQAANAALGRPLLERVAGFYVTHERAGDRPWEQVTRPARP